MSEAKGNMFFVGTKGAEGSDAFRVVVLSMLDAKAFQEAWEREVPASFTREQALNLAVWLVLVAGYREKDFALAYEREVNET